MPVTAVDDQRFGGIARLYGREGYERLRAATVAVVGIGGVGSWAAEALGRSGVGRLILMDLDDLCVTNTNRQIHALTSTLGCMKAEAMAKRLRDINPACDAVELTAFYTEQNASLLFDLKPDVVVDAIDAMNPKAHLIAACYHGGVRLVTCGGAGGRTGSSKVEIADLSRTKGDALLSKLRRKLKTEYGLPLGDKPRKLGIPCVFSQEKPLYPTCDGGVADERDAEFAGRMGCDAGFGSVTHMTGTFGFFAADAAIRFLTQ